MMRGYSVRLEWSETDRAYVATSPEFPGLTGVDEDVQTALAELSEAVDMAIEILEEDGQPLPAPRALVEHSGQFRLRVSKSLHATLARQAEEAGVSLNSYVATCLAFSAGYTQGQGELGAELRHVLHEIRAEIARSIQPRWERGAATANRFRPGDYEPADAFAAGTAGLADVPF